MFNWSKRPDISLFINMKNAIMKNCRFLFFKKPTDESKIKMKQINYITSKECKYSDHS